MGATAGSKEQFATLISRVAREVTRRRSSDACCGELTLEQFETLQAIARAGDATMTGLSGALGVDPSTMSRNVALLERSGHLRRARHAGDGRVVLVRLTAKGRTALATLRCGEADVLAEVLDRIPAAERAGVVRALETLCGCLDRRPAPAAACCAPVPLRRRSA